jgi:hypothetical protein
MTSNNRNHTNNLRGSRKAPLNTPAPDLCEEATSSAEIIRWLPLLAANDFLDEDDLPPVA